MKTYKIFILINELEEFQFGKMPGLDRPEITFQDLLSMNKDESVSITVEDVFIGNSAKWGDIKERIEEYLQLAYLREGKLEIIYYSIYDILTRLYTNDADKYFHFYDECVQRNEIEELVKEFPSSFKCSLLNRSNENIKDTIAAEKEVKSITKTKVSSAFLTICNYTPYLKLA